VAAVDEGLTARLAGGVLADILAQVPDDWLPAPAADSRAAYLRFFQERLTPPRPFVEELRHARP
jgi:hypothetical protein